MSFSSSDAGKTEIRIDLLFSKFAVFYGHIWRSQFKDDRFLDFAKKEWQEALKDFTDDVLTKAILECRGLYKLPPSLPQMIIDCRQIRKRISFYMVSEVKPATRETAAFYLKQLKNF